MPNMSLKPTRFRGRLSYTLGAKDKGVEMIEISVIDFYRAGFDGVRERESVEDLLVERELPVHVTTYSVDINGRQISEATHMEFPTNSLYEFPLHSATVGYEELKQAVAHAETSAQANGYTLRGRRLYRLVLVKTEDQRLWVRVGNEWTEPKAP